MTKVSPLSMTRLRSHSLRLLRVVLLLTSVQLCSAEVMLQYFNTSYRELAYKMPELAEVGYGALWLPPPTKGSGGLSVGYDLWDPFDLGGKDQRNTVSTRYGTEAELLHLIRVAHRFGVRVYFDNIMNHRAFDVPGYNEYTPIDVYPGMLPEDFHLRKTEEGFYRKWDNIADWSDTWQIQNRNFSDLIDIAQELPDNGNFGSSEGDHIPKLSFVRHPNNPEYYDYHATNGWVGFGDPSITAQLIADNPSYYAEDVNSYLIRAVRWLVDHTKVDGLRLDAVKHVPDYFFGLQSGDKNSSSAGYLGQAQWQFNMTRGFSDWDNHRDSVFDTELSYGRNDLMMFGEHLGSPPAYSGYIDAGMRLVDSQLHGFLNGNLGQSWGTLDGLQYAGGQGFSAGQGVPYVKSHDDDYATRPGLQFALNLTRQGLPNVYTDGNYQSETLGESGGAFPRHANINFLGQWGDGRIPNLVYIHEHFARGWQAPRWGDADICAYERVDKRENGTMSDADGTVLFFVMCDNFEDGEYREIPTNFRPGDYLWQYSTGGGNFYYEVPWDQKIKVIVPPGGYFAFSWRSPEASDLWSGGPWNRHPITIRENGVPAGWVSYVRHDGPDGDPGFNPYDVVDESSTDFSYRWWVPRVSASNNLDFIVRVDGSAENVLLKLDGGVDLNGVAHSGGDMRDHPPGNEGSTAVFDGYEQMSYNQRFREKFAAVDTARNIVGTLGAETYECTLGSSGFTINNGAGADSDVSTASWLHHDPEGVTDIVGQTLDQFFPPPETATNATIFMWVKMGYATEADNMFVYFTTNGTSFPEGAGGYGLTDDTLVSELNYATNGPADGGGVPDWWTGTLPAMAAGTTLRYKIGCFHHNAASVFPLNADQVFWKKKMVTQFSITGFDAGNVELYPHMDFAQDTKQNGLDEGFHVLRARAFLNRSASSSIYNTFVQPFYYDAEPPTGVVVYPAENDTLGNNQYGAVVRTDWTVTKVYFNVDDVSVANDDGSTGRELGNGTNALGAVSWVEASETDASLALNPTYPGYPREWRFDYNNIPTNSAATIRVKLAELSSSTNVLLSDVDGRFNTLERHVTANGPDFGMYIAYPQRDGDRVGVGYEMKTWFSPALWTGESVDTIRDRFLIRIDGVAQGRSQYDVRWQDGGNGWHELRYALPDLYNGDDNDLHDIVVTHTNAAGGGVVLTANRTVTAWPTVKGPYIDIVTPPEFDSDGKAYEIILAENCTAGSVDRQYTIKVETDLSAQHVWLEFPNDTVTLTPYASTTNALTGTVSVWNGSNTIEGAGMALVGTVSAVFSNTTVVGSNTLFTSELKVGSRLQIDTNIVTVAAISNTTQLTLSNPYSGTTTNDVGVTLMPAFDSELSEGAVLMVGSQVLTVTGILSSSNCIVSPPYAGPTASGLIGYRVDGNPQTSGDKRNWLFLWENIEPGNYWFGAHCNTNEASMASVTASAWRNTTVIFREMVVTNATLDWDDDGLFNGAETIPTNLPTQNAETWVNGDVHIWRVYGRTDPLRPDTDGDGLPDGLESGWRSADVGQTDTNLDTNCDGFSNFLPDYDPPFFNTVPDNSGLPDYVFYGSRTKLIHGTLTDPNNPDSDYDGIKDGDEDVNRNGWVDGDGVALPPGANWWDVRTQDSDWPDGEWDVAWATHPGRETDPNNSDTDGDGASDGYGEDVNYNGRIDGDTDSNRVWVVGELWQESDPLNPDTDGDGLPDGWERRYNFSPLNSGVTNAINMMTGAVITNVEHGAQGNPDMDLIVVGGVTSAYVNIMEYENGTNPRDPNSLDPPPAGSIVIGPGEKLGEIYGRSYYEEFMDWSWNDLLVLDEYEGGGPNNQLGDVYKGWDGWDESRDIVAFYAHDGGDSGSGDGKFYFRVDFYDLRPLAEEGNLDLYVVIDTGNTGQGEHALPDDVDALTQMGWEVVVACYQSGQGRVYVDLNRSNNTTTVGANLADFGVVGRSDPSDGFIDAYYSAELDAVEFSISRQALIDAGWAGSGASNFSYQVYTTKDGTSNDPVGAGDIGGRNDIRDSIYDDWIAEDYWQAQEGLENILYSWIPGTARAGRAKVASLIHGNQAIRPGNEIQELINTGNGAGYHRPITAHAVFGQPLNLHITPTLAAAIQWAAADPVAGKPWADGPALNAEIATLIDTNVVYLLGSTFSDHILPYFNEAYNRDSETLARQYLERIYATTIDPATAVFWPPERVLDYDVFDKITDMGYGYSLVDQDTHLFNWLGRTESLIEGAYRINEFRRTGQLSGRCFVINNLASSYRFNTTDNGLDISLRALLIRKARSGVRDQVVTLLSNWEDFAVNANADAYDLNLRWLANHPWTPVVALEQITRGEIDATDDGVGDAVGAGWWTQWRSDEPSVANKQSYNWLNHASQEDFDHWYVGQSGVEEGLETKHFEIRPGTALTNVYGMLYSGGLVVDAWQAVQGVVNTNLSLLARATLHASVFQTAFHDENNHDTRRYSTGQYMYPATSSNSLALFSQTAQSQTRMAALYTQVDTWAASAGTVTTPQVLSTDVDLDGEDEYILYNDRLFVLFESIGGRMTGAWIRDLLGGGVYQAMGNFVGYAGSQTEEEGAWNVDAEGAVVAYRTSGLKDWFVGHSGYVNMLYTATALPQGWRFVSADGFIQKEITLAPQAREVEVVYQLSGDLAGQTLYVRHGLSPDLADLLQDGQATLSDVSDAGGVLTLSNTNYGTTVSARIGYADAGHSCGWQSSAEDEDTNKVDYATRPMRNQAQTHQAEIFGTGSFAFALGFDAQPSDWDADGMPNTYEDARSAFLNPYDGTDGTNDYDMDGVVNSNEWISNTDPNDDTDYLHLTGAEGKTNGFEVRFPAKPQRLYRVAYDDDLVGAPGWSNATPTPITVPAPQTYTWTDDGSTTAPHPTNTTHRFYDIRVSLP
ncbi:MAG: hypothetical protein HQ523_15200 [Lentisphaerae bacterium]|nr:hypothetical protein [Lentisphaerota bacterium]